MIYIGKIILTLVDQRTWTVKINLHTFGRRFSALWECFLGCGELLQLSSDTCWTSWKCFGGTWRNDTTLVVWKCFGGTWRNDTTHYTSSVKVFWGNLKEWHYTSSVIPSSSPKTLSHVQQVLELNCNSSPHPKKHSQRALNRLPKVWRLIFTVQVLWSTSVKIIFPIYITLFRSFLHLSWWRPLVWGWN